MMVKSGLEFFFFEIKQAPSKLLLSSAKKFAFSISILESSHEKKAS
jgi:hypothetical protein